MKIALIAAAASLVLAFAAHAEDFRTDENPMARAEAPIACAMSGLAHKTSYDGVTDAMPDQSLCPQFLSTSKVKLPKIDGHT
jgi:hypothetical protein